MYTHKYNECAPHSSWIPRITRRPVMRGRRPVSGWWSIVCSPIEHGNLRSRRGTWCSLSMIVILTHYYIYIYGYACTYVYMYMYIWCKCNCHHTHTHRHTHTHTHTRVLPWELFGPYNHSLFFIIASGFVRLPLLLHGLSWAPPHESQFCYPFQEKWQIEMCLCFATLFWWEFIFFQGDHTDTHTHCSHTQTHSHTHWDYLGMCCDPWISHLFCIIAFGFVRLPLLLHGLSWAPPQESHFC
jgi:hypothetical protein